MRFRTGAGLPAQQFVQIDCASRYVMLGLYPLDCGRSETAQQHLDSFPSRQQWQVGLAGDVTRSDDGNSHCHGRSLAGILEPERLWGQVESRALLPGAGWNITVLLGCTPRGLNDGEGDRYSAREGLMGIWRSSPSPRVLVP